MDLQPVTTSDIKERFERDGFVHLKNILKPEQTLSIKMHLMHIADVAAQKHKERAKKDVTYSQGLVNSMHSLPMIRGYEAFNKILEGCALPSLTQTLMGHPTVFHTSEAFFKRAQSGLASMLHQDDAYFCVQNHAAVNVWIPLDKTDRENGTIFYLRGSHKLGLLEHEALGMNHFTCRDHEKIKNLEKVFIEAEPGDCVFHHSLTCHGSEYNKSDRSRTVLTRLYRRADAVEDTDRKNKMLLASVAALMSHFETKTEEKTSSQTRTIRKDN